LMKAAICNGLFFVFFLNFLVIFFFVFEPESIKIAMDENEMVDDSFPAIVDDSDALLGLSGSGIDLGDEDEDEFTFVNNSMHDKQDDVKKKKKKKKKKLNK
jgi:hypothetical protein